MLAKVNDAGAKANCDLSCFNDLLSGFSKTFVPRIVPVPNIPAK
ncbi:MAG: hypothetical protein ACI9HU_001969 [Colwellia sp.]|jgi:hypothetical protein